MWLTKNRKAGGFLKPFLYVLLSLFYCDLNTNGELCYTFFVLAGLSQTIKSPDWLLPMNVAWHYVITSLKLRTISIKYCFYWDCLAFDKDFFVSCIDLVYNFRAALFEMSDTFHIYCEMQMSRNGCECCDLVSLLCTVLYSNSAAE